VSVSVEDKWRPSRGCALQCLVDGSFRCVAESRDAKQIEVRERWQSVAVERGGEGGAAGVGDLGEVEVELLV
jgi:hypothetical protein